MTCHTKLMQQADPFKLVARDDRAVHDHFQDKLANILREMEPLLGTVESLRDLYAGIQDAMSYRKPAPDLSNWERKEIETPEEHWPEGTYR